MVALRMGVALRGPTAQDQVLGGGVRQPLIPPEAGMPTWWGDQGSPEACRWGALATLTECNRGLALTWEFRGLARRSGPGPRVRLGALSVEGPSAAGACQCVAMTPNGALQWSLLRWPPAVWH